MVACLKTSLIFSIAVTEVQLSLSVSFEWSIKSCSCFLAASTYRVANKKSAAAYRMQLYLTNGKADWRQPNPVLPPPQQPCVGPGAVSKWVSV